MPAAAQKRPNRLSQALLVIGFSIGMFGPHPAKAGVFLSIDVAPPPLPIYVQPIAPGPDFIWAPGYWAYDEDGYYWVPGTWVRAPRVGLLWTPGYWGWSDGYYVWHAGYWGPHIGFYGGINYGCGYTGSGYWGGHWDHGAFFYNTAVSHVNTTIIHNTYNTVIVNKTVQNVSFNGGQGGIAAKPTPQELQATHEQHVQPTALQVQHQHLASTNKAMFASVNHGAPKIAATTKPAVFSGHGVVAAKAVAPKSAATKTNLPHAANGAHPLVHTNANAAHPPAHTNANALHTAVHTQAAMHTQSQSFAQRPPRPQPKLANTHPPRPNAKPQRIAANHPQAHPHAENKKPPGKRPEH